MGGTLTTEDELALAASGARGGMPEIGLARSLEAGRAGLLGRLLATDERLLVAARRWHGPWTRVARGLTGAGDAASWTLVVLMLHHYLHPLPGDDLFDRLSAWAGWPFADELRLGGALLHRLAGHCDLVLHGHRHRPGELVLGADGSRLLRVLNAGASPAQGGARVFTHVAGRIVSERWLLAAGAPAPVRSASGLPAAA